eukprot:SM000002S05715  [mRNA]  locus=s2:1760287:1761398:- [translate_table: standard]
MRLRHLGTTGFHATFIRQLAILVMRQQLGTRFEWHSEMEPHLATVYPGGPKVAKKFQRELRRSLTPQPQIAIGEITVLYITRLDQKVTTGRRMFTTESHEALLGLFAKLGFRVRMVEFQVLTARVSM